MKRSALDYIRKKSECNEAVSDAVIGFLDCNNVSGSEEEIEKVIETASKLRGGKIIGEGDLFKQWCNKNGRPIPSDEIISLMNRNPQAGREAIKNNPNRGRMMFSLCSFLAGKGRKSVRAL